MHVFLWFDFCQLRVFLFLMGAGVLQCFPKEGVHMCNLCVIGTAKVINNIANKPAVRRRRKGVTLKLRL